TQQIQHARTRRHSDGWSGPDGAPRSRSAGWRHEHRVLPGRGWLVLRPRMRVEERRHVRGVQRFLELPLHVGSVAGVRGTRGASSRTPGGARQELSEMRKTRWVTGTGAVLAACLAAVTACDRGAEVRAAPSDAAAAVPAPPRKGVERFQARLVASSGEDAPFSAVTGLDVDSEGRIYVADWLLPDVVVLGPDGRHVRSIGRRGSGPGEFQRVSSVQVLPGDSVLVFDRGLRRVTVFPPSGGEA